MTEYEELQSELAEELFKQYGQVLSKWSDIHIVIKLNYLKEADKLLSTIAERCWLKDEKKLPENKFDTDYDEALKQKVPEAEIRVMRARAYGWRIGINDLMQRWWRPVKELKKVEEAKD